MVRLGSGVVVAVGGTEVDVGVGVLLLLTMGCVTSAGVAGLGVIPSASPLLVKKMSAPTINNSSRPPATKVIFLLKSDRLDLSGDASCASGETTFSAGAGMFTPPAAD